MTGTFLPPFPPFTAIFNHPSNGPYREGKRSICEGGHRVPFFVHWPAGILGPGREDDGPVCQTDLLATFAELLEAKLPAAAGEDSRVFFKALTERGKQERMPMKESLTRIVVRGRSTPGDPVSNDTGYWGDLYWMDEIVY